MYSVYFSMVSDEVEQSLSKEKEENKLLNTQVASLQQMLGQTTMEGTLNHLFNFS